MYISVVPAYGRDYKNKKEVQAAWEAGKDFRIVSIPLQATGSYINKADKERYANDDQITVRYDNYRKVYVIGSK